MLWRLSNFMGVITPLMTFELKSWKLSRVQVLNSVDILTVEQELQLNSELIVLMKL